MSTREIYVPTVSYKRSTSFTCYVSDPSLLYPACTTSDHSFHLTNLQRVCYFKFQRKHTDPHGH